MNQTLFEKTVKPRAIEELLDFYFYRRLAAWLIPGLVRLGLSPNQITTLSLTCGLVSAVLIYFQLFILAAFMAMVAIVFDCCDGQVARLTGKTHPLGRVMDGFFDLIWIAFSWAALFFSGYFQSQGIQPLTLMALAGASMIVHCWRFDAAKIKYLERVDENFHEDDLDVPTAYQLFKSEWRQGHFFLAFLAFMIMFQMYFFVRGAEKKQKLFLSHADRQVARKQLEPIINHWSYIGEGHHNSLVILGLFFASQTPFVLLAAFWIIFVPMNVWWIYCEIRFKRALATH